MSLSQPVRGKLYVVALPIGNAADITVRARDILGTVDVIAAEDTRKARDWFQRCSVSIRGRVLASHSHNESASAGGIIPLILEGQNAALVSDAGTPRVSDPGYALVKAAREAGIEVIPVPGASALTALLSVCDLRAEPLLFLGFLSPKSGTRANQLAKYRDFEGGVCLYESVHRIEKLLAAVHEQWGDCKVLIGREMTKTHEEYFSGSLSDSMRWAKGKKGELAIMIEKKG